MLLMTNQVNSRGKNMGDVSQTLAVLSHMDMDINTDRTNVSDSDLLKQGGKLVRGKPMKAVIWQKTEIQDHALRWNMS